MYASNSPSSAAALARWSKTASERAASVLFTTRIAGVSTSRASDATNRSPGPYFAFASTTTHTRSTSRSVARARSLVRSPSSVRGRCNPGVSTKTIWLASVVRTPRIAARVVCGRSDTITTFCPTSWFTSVDLPTLGRPMSVTKPDFTVSGRASRSGVGERGRRLARLGGRRHEHRHDALAFHALHREVVALARDRLAAVGNTTEEVEDESTDGVPLVVGEVHTEKVAHVTDRRASVHAQPTAGQALDLGVFDVELVGDLADDLLEDVLHRDEPRGVAVLVDDDRHVELLRLHLAQQLGDALLLGDEHRRSERVADAFVGRAGVLPSNEVLEVHEADDVVGTALVRRDARKAGVDRGADPLLDHRVDFDRDHVGTREHHLAHERVAEFEDRVDELALFVLDRLFLGRDVGHGPEVFLGDERTLFETLAGHHGVGEADQCPSEQPQRREVGDAVEQTRAAERGAVGVLDRVRLGNHLGDDEEEHQLEHEADDDADRAEVAVEQDAEQIRARELRDEHEEEQAVDRPLRVLEHDGELLRPAAAFVGQRQRADAVHPRERHLGEAQDRRADEQHEDDPEEHPVARAHGDSTSAPANDESSSRSRRCIRSASSGSAWSYPKRCSVPCTTRSASSSSSAMPRSLACCCATSGQTTTSPIASGGSGGSLDAPGPRPPSSG